MGFIYPNKFTYLNIFMIELAHRCSDDGSAIVSNAYVSSSQFNLELWGSKMAVCVVGQ